MSLSRFYGITTFRLAYRLANILPRGICQALAGLLGRTSCRFKKKSREALHENLRLVTGASGSELDDLCRDNFANFLKMLADYFYCTGDHGEHAASLLEDWRGFENLTAALARGKGVILITGHLGNWESAASSSPSGTSR